MQPIVITILLLIGTTTGECDPCVTPELTNSIERLSSQVTEAIALLKEIVSRQESDRSKLKSETFRRLLDSTDPTLPSDSTGRSKYAKDSRPQKLLRLGPLELNIWAGWGKFVSLVGLTVGVLIFLYDLVSLTATIALLRCLGAAEALDVSRAARKPKPDSVVSAVIVHIKARSSSIVAAAVVSLMYQLTTSSAPFPLVVLTYVFRILALLPLMFILLESARIRSTMSHE